MSDRINSPQREEEEDIDFSDTKEFAFTRYELAVAAVKQTLSAADQERVNQFQDWQKVQFKIRTIVSDPKSLPITKRLLTQIIPLPRSLYSLVKEFASAVHPSNPDVSIIWGLTELNIKLSCLNPEKLTHTVGWMKRLRSVVELFNRCLDVCDDMNEPRIAMVDSRVRVSGFHANRNIKDADIASGWKILEKRIDDNLNNMDLSTKHLNDINAYSKVNLERQTKTLTLRHGSVPHPEEHVTFPMSMIPRNKNEDFYGRADELKNINEFLGHKATNLRTYTIYGRRGVGKVDIALEYAQTNPAGFDAIFWVNCETSLALRQSFTDMAVTLNIPGADRNGHHEENQLAVLKWLKTTKRQWLLIFDNAERESVLKGYWPVSVQGSILITSRKYYNFTNDAHRKGDTIKPFTPKESWSLLMKLLGPEWVEKDGKGLITAPEERAATELLKCLGGLPLAIEQAAELIKDDCIGGLTIVSTYNQVAFKEQQCMLPERPAGSRSDTVLALDSLWNMRFTNLSRNGLALLSVLSLLSPDRILIDLFLPRNQKALDGKLAFCKQVTTHTDESNTQAALSSVITAPPLLRKAIDELVSFKLIKQEGRELWAHRVVQEAMNYHSAEDLQDCFDSAVALVYEAFPKQVHGDNLSGQWGTCETYIPHGTHLSFQFANLNKSMSAASKLKGNSKFIDLLSNCAWFLYEISDYRLSLQLIDTARRACQDRESHQYATLCMIAGSAFYELNQLSECRKNWEICMAIQEANLQSGHLELSNCYHNMGNIEAADSIAADSLEKATTYLERAISIRVAHGDTANSLLANSYLCMSRVYFLKEYEEALTILGRSEALFYRISGADAHFMAHVHYAYGNIDFAQKRWAAAKRAYEASLRIGLASAPIHPITAAAYYSLGCVEQERRNIDHAKAYLDKAMAIAQLRSPDRDDGTMARIMWKMSQVLESDPFGTFLGYATELRIRAELALKTLTANGEGGILFSLDEEGNADHDEMKDAYDSLVPGYFR
ncbi:hypothetical protein V8E51_004264 [Hyaloscypha variabilis]